MKKLTSIPESLTNKLQVNGITDNSVTISGKEAMALFKMISALTIYNAAKGLPEDLVDLLNHP